MAANIQRPTPPVVLYYIHVQPHDKLFRKEGGEKYTSIDYLCECHANKKNMHFNFVNTDENYLRDTLPTKVYTMMEFAKVANKVWSQFKERELYFANIYIIEDTKEHRYHYYKVKFYPDPHEE
ncbi:hypothetical protein HQ865_07875 [Mucilaginibacter mali]|uniref:Uncharacterized protein n=1 Tax=Mucilaginibacter mali TaxID=2740462 RepID=A0A7D4TUD2_9SPHI|nr:hypothetical protein [Mucilaginibacter mali]QKJ29675.1 hypothetical protein HQ865_07875 [Mucilaginibacter mali]